MLFFLFLQTNEFREVLHFQYTTWPDFGVPSSPLAFLNFLMAVRESDSLDNNYGPCIVHCSAGIGRSGTFSLVDSALVIVSSFSYFYFFFFFFLIHCLSFHKLAI